MSAYFVFNLVFAGIGVIYVFSLYRNHYIPARFMNDRFRLFALRDQLARLACEGKIEEDSDIYLFHLRCLNDTISHLESLDFYSFLKWRLKTEKDEGYIRAFRAIVEKTRDKHPDVVRIMEEYERITLFAMYDNSWILRHAKIVLVCLSVQNYISLNSLRFVRYCMGQAREFIDVPEVAKKRLHTAGISV